MIKYESESLDVGLNRFGIRVAALPASSEGTERASERVSFKNEEERRGSTTPDLPSLQTT